MICIVHSILHCVITSIIYLVYIHVHVQHGGTVSVLDSSSTLNYITNDFMHTYLRAIHCMCAIVVIQMLYACMSK